MDIDENKEEDIDIEMKIKQDEDSLRDLAVTREISQEYKKDEEENNKDEKLLETSNEVINLKGDKNIEEISDEEFDDFKDPQPKIENKSDENVVNKDDFVESEKVVEENIKDSNLNNDDSFEDFAEPEQQIIPQQSEDSSESDKIEMREDDDSFEDFAEPECNKI